MTSQTLTYTKLADRNVSFGLLRTNPKLTSNLKLTVDSGGNLWFNSIDAVEQLAQQKYKKFAINPVSNHEVNIFRFYDMGATPSKISYALGSSIRTDVVAKDLKDQYDFDLYTSGAKYLTSKNYSEKFSYLAPLYLDKVLPEYFVIFKVSGASNYTTAEWYQQNGAVSQSQFALDLFRNATIVKAIPLTADSNIGTYIRRILSNPMYPENPLYVNVKQDRYSLYRGASINSGTYVEIPEIISSTLIKSIPQLTLEKYITGGFERNNVIYPKILNLEFLFDDVTANPYEFNRYIGFYCNALDLATFDIDLTQMYLNSDNDNPLPNKFNQSDEINLTISNSNGVVLRAENITSDLSFINSALDSEDSLFFPYLKTKNNDLHFLKTDYSANATTFSQVGSSATFAIDDATFDLGLTFGPGALLSQEKAKAYSENTRSTVSVTIETPPSHLDTLRVYHQNGSTFDKTDLHGRYDDIVFVSNYFLNNEEYSLDYPQVNTVEFDTPDPNDMSTIFTPNSPGVNSIVTNTQYVSSQTGVNWVWDGTQYIVKTIGSRIYVNIENATINSVSSTDTSKLAETIIKIVESLTDSFLIGETFKNTAVIQTRAYGNNYGMLAVKINQANSAIKINSQITDSIIYADGGFLETQQAIIPIGNIDRLTPLIDKIVVKTQKDWSKILRVCNSAAGINNQTGELTANKVSAFNSNATLMLEDQESIIVQYDKIEIRNLFKPSIGVLSLFEIKDIDFNTFTSDYSKIPEVDLYQYYWVPANIQILDFTKYKYSIIGVGSIQVNETIYNTDTDDTVWQDRDGLHSYTVLAGDVILVQSNILPYSSNTVRTDIGIYDEDENLQNFTGFFSLGADHSAPDQATVTYPYREKFKTNNLASEYHVYLENFSKDFSIDGKVVPYISKWGIINSTDARGNAYRLNSDIAFGKDNFGPSHRETTPTAEKLTHEWFYIESDFNYSLDETLLRKNYYYFNSPINVNQLITESDYFEKYFTYIPTINGKEIDHPQFRYSKLIKDEFTNQYNTVFNGAKFLFSELKDTGEILPNTNRFADYNFSILLKPVAEDLEKPQSPISFRIIENMDAKSILILIEIALSGITKINPTLLQESSQFEDLRLDQTKLFLNSKVIYDLAPRNFQVSAIYTASSSTEFNALKSGLYPNVSTLAGTAVDPISNQPINLLTGGSYDVDNYPVVLVEYGTEQLILAFKNSEIFNQVINQELLSGSYNNANPTQYLTVSKPVHVILGTTGSDLIRVFDNTTDPTQLSAIELMTNGVFSIVGAKPSFLGAFGDYRLSFNENGVSNLTYNFIYSVKDKKYNSTKSAFSTVKLATGVDISGSAVYISPTQVSTISGNLANLPANAFVLEDFINPNSASFDSLLFPGVGIQPPLPAFSPLLFINQNGVASMPLKTSADFSGDTAINILREDLSNPSVTTHLLKSVQENLLIFETPEIISEFSDFIIPDPAYTTTTSTTTSPSTTTTTTVSGTTTTTTTVFPGINLSTDYTGQYIRATLIGVTSTKLKVGDVVKIEDINTSTEYVRAQVTNIQVSPNGLNLLISFLVRYQNPSAVGSNSNDWIITCKRDTIVLKPTLSASLSGPQINLTSSAFPGGSTSDWLNSSQQFQLFGGKSYFTNLFENISFASFINLLDSKSPLISVETYNNGQLLPGQKIKLSIETADQIEKSTIVQALPEQVETASQTKVGGFTHTESQSQKYEVFRYSGEYDVIFRPISGFNYSTMLGGFDLTGSNCLLNPRVNNFFVMPEFSFVKYSQSEILDFESSATYKALYPLIGESPIATTKYNVLSSSWDFNYHYKYLTKNQRVPVSGTNRISEDYSFLSKLLNVPIQFTAESFNTKLLTNSQFEITDSAFSKLESNGSIVDIAYSVYPTEVKLKINLANIISKTLIDFGLRAEFHKFFIDQFNNPITTDVSLIGELTLEQYLTAYCKANLVKLYELDIIDFYEKPDHTLADNSLSIANVPYSQLDELDYSLIKEVKINNPKSAVLTGSIYKKSSTGISLVPKLKIKYI